MKRIVSQLVALLLAVAWASIATAQVPAYVSARIEQVGRRFADPSNFDTLFTPGFLSEVPASSLAPIFQQIASKYGAVTRWYVTREVKPNAVEAKYLLQKSGERAASAAVNFAIDVDPEEPHLIEGLRFFGVSPLIPTLDSVVAAIRGLPGRAGMQISSVQLLRAASPTTPPTRRDAGIYVQLPAKSSSTIIKVANADSLFALGSSFKLWVFSALVHKIEGTQASWSDVINLDSASRSLPSGILQTWPVGSPVTLATAATEMISISDNTATDLLIHYLGRDAIEDAMIGTGSTHLNANNQPFLTTLEMFKLKSGTAALAKKYLTLSVHNREEFLKNVVDPMPRDSVVPWTEPRMIDKIEWFATPAEMTQVLLWLKDHTNSATPDSATSLGRDILAVNPGLHIDKKAWDYVGFKGGSEPGVITMNYLLQTHTGKWYTLTAAWNNTRSAVDEEEFAGLVERAIELLGEDQP